MLTSFPLPDFFWGAERGSWSSVEGEEKVLLQVQDQGPQTGWQKPGPGWSDGLQLQGHLLRPGFLLHSC